MHRYVRTHVYQIFPKPMMMPKDIQHRKLLIIQPFGPFDTALQIQTGNLLLTKDEEKADKIPLYSLLAIFIIGRLTVTTHFLKKCADCGVAIFFLSESFTTYARCGAQTEGNYILRQTQYAASPAQDLIHAKLLIQHKALSQSKALEYFAKRPLPTIAIDDIDTRESLLGIEGHHAVLYFAQLFESIGWHKRLPQAKPDEINLLMDMGYTMLFNLTDAMLGLFGFDTYRGVYHQLFFARKSLVCDLMEPWRPLIDVSILLMYRQNIFRKADFKVVNGTITFTNGFRGRSKYARAFLKTLSSHKLTLFEYIRRYYLHISKPDKYELKAPNIDFSTIVLSSS